MSVEHIPEVFEWTCDKCGDKDEVSTGEAVGPKGWRRWTGERAYDLCVKCNDERIRAGRTWLAG
mgnify:FL=1